jgi:hypothetical protein
MNAGSVDGSPSGTLAGSGLPVRFIVVTFVAAAAVGAAIVYFGLQGQLGAGVP